MSLAKLLTERVQANARRPHDFGAALDALRHIETMFIRGQMGDFEDAMDELDIVRRYVYERATSDEMHQRAGLVLTKDAP